MRIALFQPDIALNVGSIMRTAACLDCPVDVILPCGFPFSLKSMHRSGMDYLDKVECQTHASWAHFLENRAQGRLLLMTSKGEASASQATFAENDILLFGRESAGAPDYVHAAADLRLRVPMRADVRSFNLAISVAITLTLAYQQRNLFEPLR